jgi:hypothetical protein
MAVDNTKRRDEASSGDTPTKEKELAEVCARFADLCQYFSQQNMDLPAQIVEEVRSVSKLAVEDRVARMKRLNQELMEYLHGASPGPQIRQ